MQIQVNRQLVELVTMMLYINSHLQHLLLFSSHHHIQGSSQPYVSTWSSPPVNLSCWGTRWLRTFGTSCRLWLSGTRPCSPPCDSLEKTHKRRQTAERERTHGIRHGGRLCEHTKSHQVHEPCREAHDTALNRATKELPLQTNHAQCHQTGSRGGLELCPERKRENKKEREEAALDALGI